MTPRLKLSAKIALLVLLNIGLIAATFGAFFIGRLPADLGSVILGDARERLGPVARLASLELRENGQEKWDGLLQRYAADNGVAFHLYTNFGRHMAGPEVQLPRDILERMKLREGPPGGPPPPRDDDPGPPDDRRPRPARPFLVITDSPRMYWIGLRMPPLSFNGERAMSTLLMASPSIFTNPFFIDLRPGLAAAAAVLVISLLCWVPLIRGLTKSIGQITRVTESIAEGQFDVHVQTTRRDELGQLSSAINRMSSRLEGFVKGQKRFLGDIAHELCSPLARMQLALAIVERDATPRMMEHLNDLKEEVEEMSTLVNELLSFSKAGINPEGAKLAPVKLADVFNRVVQREGGEGRSVEVKTPTSLAAYADEGYVYRSVANLVRNALRYAGDAGPVVVSAEADGADVLIRVADSGPGLPAEALDRVFTPFYRLEESRNRGSGGAGLGLAIVKSCIEACHGTITCRNRVPRGLEVEIRLPAA